MLCKGIIIIINLHKYLAVIAPLFMTEKRKKENVKISALWPYIVPIKL